MLWNDWRQGISLFSYDTRYVPIVFPGNYRNNSNNKEIYLVIVYITFSNSIDDDIPYR